MEEKGLKHSHFVPRVVLAVGSGIIDRYICGY